MIIKKNWTILLILTIAIASAMFFFVTEREKSLSSKQAIVTEQRLFQNSKEAQKSEITDPPLSIVQKNLTKEEIPEKSVTSPTLSKTTKIMDIHQERKKDPTITLKISDFPPKEQALQKEWLTNYNENGYIQTSEVSFDYIKSQNELIEQVEPDPSKISISLQETSTTKLSTYEYLGIVLDTEETKREQNNLNSKITRAYKGNDGQEIFLLEKEVQNSKAILVDEFVTEHINGYPASRMTFCTENHRCMSKITLITKDKFYEISTYGDQNATKDNLIEIISSFDLPELEAQLKQ